MKLKLNNYFTEPNFYFDNIDNCYKSKKKNNNVNFEFNVNQDDKYFFIFEYNCTQIPKILLKINNNIVSYNLIHTNTQTLDKHLSFSYEYGPIFLHKGINKFNLIGEGFFPDIYNIELNNYKNTLNIYPNIFQYNIKDFVIINSYNIYGGFFWHLNNYLICCYFCEKYNKIPIVNFNSSLFLNNTDVENKLIVSNNNWFFNYFNNHINIPYTIYNTLVNYTKKIKITNDNLERINNIDKNKLLEFKREAFTYFAKEFHSDKKNYNLVNKYFKFLPYIEEKVKLLKNVLYPEKYKLYPHLFKIIGIHYRGTDKIIEENALEQYPKHYKYYEILNIIKEKIKSLSNYEVIIAITTDEDAFIKYMLNNLDNKIVFYEESFRSSINSQNINSDFRGIPTRNIKYNPENLNEEDRKKYLLREKLINNSIHLGNKNISNFKKGLDCLIDCLMLSDADILYRSTGNFSLFCNLFNKDIDNLEVIKLNDIIN